MRKFQLLVGLFALMLLAPAASATGIIVVNDTVEKIYGIETMKVSGSLSTNTMRLTGSGEVISGDNVKVYLVGPPESVLVRNLVVNSSPKAASFDPQGYFFLADKGPFSFSADLDIKTLGQISLYIKGPVNLLTFDLKDGYAIGGDIFGAYGKSVIIQRSSAAEPVDHKKQTLLEGRFHHIFGPERNDFDYGITFSAFGTSLGRYEIELPNQETVITVTGALKWEQQGSRLILDLSGQKAAVSVAGVFTGPKYSLQIPELSGGRHYVLIESDPEKRLTILKTTAEEIDLSQAQLTPRYSNARAFLASSADFFELSVEDLTVLPSLSASVKSAQNRIAITEKGSILGELSYSYANTGLDYIAIESEGTPLYAATGRGAAKLTKDRDQILLALPKTDYGSLDYVYFTTRNSLNPIELIDVPIAKTDLPITTAYTSIYLPRNYFVLWTFGAEGGSELPSLEALIIFLIAVLIVSSALYKNKKFVLLYTIVALGLAVYSPILFILLIIASIIEIARRYVRKNTSILAIIAGAVILLLVLVAVFIGFTFLWEMRSYSTITKSMDADASEYYANYAQVSEASAGDIIKEFRGIGSGAGAISVPTKTGVLPVKLDIPYLGKTVSVTSHLVTKENPLSIKILVIADWFKYILYVLSAIAFVKAYGMYKSR